jgi:hypothetical protein
MARIYAKPQIRCIYPTRTLPKLVAEFSDKVANDLNMPGRSASHRVDFTESELVFYARIAIH